MSRIYVNIRGIRNANYNVPSILSGVSHAGKSLKNLSRKIAAEIRAGRRIQQRLDHAYAEIRALEKQIDELYKITNSCVAQYESAERENSRNAEMFL